MSPAPARDSEEHLRRRRDGRSVARLEVRCMNYIFGDYILDDTRYELRRSGESVAIEPKRSRCSSTSSSIVTAW